MQFLKNNDMKKFFKIIAILMTLIVVLCGCENNINLDSENNSDEDTEQTFFSLTREDSRIEFFTPNEINVYQQSIVKIEEGGDYILQGETKGTVVVDAEDQIVHLFLNDLNIQSTDGPAIYIKSAGKVIITVMEGTENRISDNGRYSDEEINACIYSVCDLTINGSGKFYVYGYYKDAIHSKDLVKIIDTDIYCQSKRDAIHANDGIYVTGANCLIEAEGKGIYTSKSGKNNKGYVEIENSKISIVAGEYAIDSAAGIISHGGTLYLKGIYGNTNAVEEIQLDEGSLQNE